MIRSQSAGVIGAAVSGLLWQAGAVAAPLMVKQAIDHGVLKRDHGALLVWLGFLLAVAVAEGRTVITIAHRLSTAQRADRVAVMQRGRLVEVASHDELVEQGDRYARLWASWQAGLAAP